MWTAEAELLRLTRRFALRLASGDDAWIPELDLVLPSYWPYPHRSIEVFRLSGQGMLEALEDATQLATRSGRLLVTIKDVVDQASSGTHLGAYHTADGLEEMALMLSQLALESGASPLFGPIGTAEECLSAVCKNSLYPLLRCRENRL